MSSKIPSKDRPTLGNSLTWSGVNMLYKCNRTIILKFKAVVTSPEVTPHGLQSGRDLRAMNKFTEIFTMGQIRFDCQTADSAPGCPKVYLFP
jgi:hypothetical protein